MGRGRSDYCRIPQKFNIKLHGKLFFLKIQKKNFFFLFFFFFFWGGGGGGVGVDRAT